MAPQIDDHLDEAWKLLVRVHDLKSSNFGPVDYAAVASAHIQLWYAERIRQYEQAQEEWRRKQWEGSPPPPPLPFPGYGGF